MQIVSERDKLKMPVIGERDKLKTYFYEWHPYLDLMFWIGVICCCTMFLSPIGIGILGIWAIARITVLLMSTSGDEILYDRLLKQDIEFLRQRSIDSMGMVDEEYSLIEPIETVGYGTDEIVNVLKISVEKRDFISKIIDFFKQIFFKFIAFVRALIGRPDFVSQEVFFEGNDKKIRTSLVWYTRMVFTEKQIVAFDCIYDIALGIIINENVREVFYRDVDSVNYGDETLHVFTKKFRLVREIITRVRLSVPSGKDIVASMLGENDTLENQVMAMKSLIRSKKEEMS